MVITHSRAVRSAIRSGISRALLLSVAGACLAAWNCGGAETIWAARALAPGGAMVATARTSAQSGFGTGYIGTVAYLQPAKGSQAPTEILVLSDETEAPEPPKVRMRWLSPTHLELSYDPGRQTIDFQAVKFAGIEISTIGLPAPAPVPARPSPCCTK